MAADLLAFVLRAGGKNAYRDVINALWERQPIYSGYDIQLEVPSHRDPDPAERPLVERIFAAYQRAKRTERDVDPVFLPSGGWKKVVDSAYSYLIRGGAHNDLEPFHYFLANFGSWDEPTGIEESSERRRAEASQRKRQHLEQHEMGQLIHWWKTYESRGRELSALTIPRYGNQTGLRVNGHSILPNSVFSDFYARMLAGLIAKPQPVIGELGGGYGRLCYFLSRHLEEDFHYVAFDLPEGLCCATYYLMSAFPDKRFLLYGERELTSETLHEYDFVLRPAFEIGKLPNDSVDLFINENSLGIMTPAACRLFIQEICRAASAFWHRNHEVRRNPFDDGTTSLVNSEYPIPRDRFRQLLRYQDIARIIGHDRSTIKNDMVWYYFCR